MLCRQWLKVAIRKALILNENQVPQLNKTPAAFEIDGAIVFVGMRAGTFAQIDVEFRTWSTGAHFRHFPEIIFFIKT